MKDCVFCKIVKGQVPSAKIWEDDNHIAFLSIFPNTEGFTVVASKKHLPSYAFANTDKDLADLVIATKKVVKILDATFEDVERCGMFFEGYGVDHLHSKLYPMHGVVGNKKWRPIESDAAHLYFDKYPGYLSSNNSKRADDGQLNKLAEKIREAASKMNL
jgi:diadenosine tetraphosphate (Ap4A) HIT family hydrolase